MYQCTSLGKIGCILIVTESFYKTPVFKYPLSGFRIDNKNEIWAGRGDLVQVKFFFPEFPACFVTFFFQFDKKVNGIKTAGKIFNRKFPLSDIVKSPGPEGCNGV